MSRFLIPLIVFLILVNLSSAQQTYHLMDRKWIPLFYSDSAFFLNTPDVYPYIVDFNEETYTPFARLVVPEVSQKNPFAFQILPILAAGTAFSEKKQTLDYYLGGHIKAAYKNYLSGGITWYKHQGLLPEFAKHKIDSMRYLPAMSSFSAKDGLYRSTLFEGYIHVAPMDYLSFTVGKGKHFIGPGYRSLFLSDHAPPYLYAKAQLNLKKIDYLYLLSFLNGYSTIQNTPQVESKKYSATHYLSYQITRAFRLSIFETVVWAPDDSTVNRGLDFNYLNPVVFFRPVEFSTGSPDNVLLGLSAQYVASPAFMLYGQFLLDEFNLSFATQTENWWGNKYGYQLGAAVQSNSSDKRIYAFAEYNQMRPFTYSHFYNTKSYGHAYYPLAHPLGSNFREFILGIQARKNKFFARNTFLIQQYALDPEGTNYGNNLFLPNFSRSLDYGSVLLQGDQKNVAVNHFSIHYQIHPTWKTWLSAEYSVRKSSNKSLDHYIFIGLKTGLAQFHIYDSKY